MAQPICKDSITLLYKDKLFRENKIVFLTSVWTKAEFF